MSIPKNSNLSPYYYENSEGRQPDSTLAQYNNNPGNIMYYQIDFDSGEIIWQTPTRVLGFGKNITLRNINK